MLMILFYFLRNFYNNTVLPQIALVIMLEPVKKFETVFNSSIFFLHSTLMNTLANQISRQIKKNIEK